MKNLRQPGEKCLLCLQNFATQTNSHILTKSAFNKLLGPKSDRKGMQFKINSELIQNYNASTKEVIRDTTYIQDIPKEDFLFCPECESYFGIIEDIAVPFFKNYRRNEKFDLQYAEFIHINNRSFARLKIDYPLIAFLFVYIQFFRAAVSKSLKDFKLPNVVQKGLSQLLLQYKSTSKSDFIGKIKQPFYAKIEYPIAILTAERFVDDTENFVLFLPSYPPNIIFADQFILMLFPTLEYSLKMDPVLPNVDQSLIKIGVMPYAEWIEFRKGLLQTILKIYKP